MGILGNIKAIKDRWASIDLVEETSHILFTKEEELAKLNRKQLLAGEGSDGNYLPKYSDDIGGYFKTPQAAMRYEEWKAVVSPNKDKPRGVMDFYINGYTHSRLFAQVIGDKITFGTNTAFKTDIEHRAPFAFGLNNVSKRLAWVTLVREDLIQRVKRKTGAK